MTKNPAKSVVIMIAMTMMLLLGRNLNTQATGNVQVASKLAVPTDTMVPAVQQEEQDNIEQASPQTTPLTVPDMPIQQRPANPWEVPLFDDELTAIYETCEEWHFAPELALALIWTESRFDREAVNVDCYGLCQLKEKYFPGASNMTGAENIRAGLTYIGKLLARYGDLSSALCAYRWGHDTGDRSYAQEVLHRLEYYGGSFGV